MSDALVTLVLEDGIVDVRLNRPVRYNALSPEMFAAIRDAGKNLRVAKDVRAVVLSGNVSEFCSGLGMSSFAKMSDASNGRKAKEKTKSLYLAKFGQKVAYANFQKRRPEFCDPE